MGDKGGKVATVLGVLLADLGFPPPPTGGGVRDMETSFTFSAGHGSGVGHGRASLWETGAPVTHPTQSGGPV